MHNAFLPFFASPLGLNTHKGDAAAAGQNLVCGRKYNQSRVRPEHNDLIEKMVSKQTENLRICYGFSPLFLNCC